MEGPPGLYMRALLAPKTEPVGWPLRVAESVETIAPPGPSELEILRALHARTREAHRRPVHVPA